MPASPKILSGNETLSGEGFHKPEATARNFWRWAYSNLQMNILRGDFSEWQVAMLLDLQPLPKNAWAPYDLETPEGISIEVKSAAFLQEWSGGRSSEAVRFSGLRGRTWTVENGYAPSETYNADMYVFCLQIERNLAEWKAFALDQWRYFVLEKSVLVFS